jgi:hypothetical protein
MLIKTINTKELFFNELFIYRKNDNERMNKDFIITKTSRIHQLIETRRCRIFDQSNRMRLKQDSSHINDERDLTKQLQ